jgi:hypothetical protein
VIVGVRLVVLVFIRISVFVLFFFRGINGARLFVRTVLDLEFNAGV